MLKKAVSFVAVLALALSVGGGCATQQAQEHKGALVGAGVGAAAGGVVGGVIGHQSGHTAEGVVIGSLIGGLAGAAIGHYAYDQKRTEQQAKEQYAYNYQQTEANLVRVESVAVVPDRVPPGGKVELVATYTVLGPQGTVMDVTETREVRSSGMLQGKPQITVQRQGGTYESRVPMILPANAAKGQYLVSTNIASGASSDTREAGFTVY